MSSSVGLREILDAHRRIAGRVRLTPVLSAQPTKMALERPVMLKLENLQITGSFKARGATAKLTTLAPERLSRGLCTASGGNHGLGVAYAAWSAGVPARIFLPANSPAYKIEKLRQWGADVVLLGQVWDEANDAAMAEAEAGGMAYVHPFADAAVIAGQGTAGVEFLEQAPDIAAIYVAIGGGGLLSGVATAVKALRPDVRVIGVEPVGAPTLHESLKAGRVVTLERIATRANTLAPRRSADLNFDLIRQHVDDIVLVTDEEMEAAARALWFDFGLAVELSAAAGFAAMLADRGGAPRGKPVGVLVCGAGEDGLTA